MRDAAREITLKPGLALVQVAADGPIDKAHLYMIGIHGHCHKQRGIDHYPNGVNYVARGWASIGYNFPRG